MEAAADETEYQPRVSLLPSLPDYHARAMGEAKEHLPLFRLSMRIVDSKSNSISFQDDGHRGFDLEHTLKFVQGETYTLSLELNDLGCTITSLDYLVLDEARRGWEAGSQHVSLQEHPTGDCPVFLAACQWSPNGSQQPTAKGQRDVLLLGLHYMHGTIPSYVDFRFQACDLRPFRVGWSGRLAELLDGLNG